MLTHRASVDDVTWPAGPRFFEIIVSLENR